MKQNLKPTVIAIIAVAAGAAGFWGGIMYQKSKQPNFGPGNFNRTGDRVTMMGQGNNLANQKRNGVANGGMIAGEITARDEKSITVRTRDGSSKIVIIGSATKFTQSQETTITDAKTGESVVISGTANTDGSFTAESVMLNPEFKNMPAPTPGNQPGQ
jgi:hypothetical protein